MEQNQAALWSGNPDFDQTPAARDKYFEKYRSENCPYLKKFPKPFHISNGKTSPPKQLSKWQKVKPVSPEHYQRLTVKSNFKGKDEVEFEPSVYDVLRWPENIFPNPNQKKRPATASSIKSKGKNLKSDLEAIWNLTEEEKVAIQKVRAQLLAATKEFEKDKVKSPKLSDFGATRQKGEWTGETEYSKTKRTKSPRPISADTGKRMSPLELKRNREKIGAQTRGEGNFPTLLPVRDAQVTHHQVNGSFAEASRPHHHQQQQQHPHQQQHAINQSLYVPGSFNYAVSARLFHDQDTAQYVEQQKLQQYVQNGSSMSYYPSTTFSTSHHQAAAPHFHPHTPQQQMPSSGSRSLREVVHISPENVQTINVRPSFGSYPALASPTRQPLVPAIEEKPRFLTSATSSPKPQQQEAVAVVEKPASPQIDAEDPATPTAAPFRPLKGIAGSIGAIGSLLNEIKSKSGAMALKKVTVNERKPALVAKTEAERDQEREEVWAWFLEEIQVMKTIYDMGLSATIATPKTDGKGTSHIIAPLNTATTTRASSVTVSNYDIVINLDEIELEKLLGRGKFASVYTAKWYPRQPESQIVKTVISPVVSSIDVKQQTRRQSVEKFQEAPVITELDMKIHAINNELKAQLLNNTSSATAGDMITQTMATLEELSMTQAERQRQSWDTSHDVAVKIAEYVGNMKHSFSSPTGEPRRGELLNNKQSSFYDVFGNTTVTNESDAAQEFARNSGQSPQPAYLQHLHHHSSMFNIFHGVPQPIEIAEEFKKKLPPIATVREFHREIKALLALKDHKNIITFIGVMTQPLAIVLRKVSNGNLYNCLNNRVWQGSMGHVERLMLVHDISQALAYMHSKLYVHRDLKPHNILLDAHRGTFSAVLGDLGTAIELNSKDDVLHEVVGTSGYAAPEMLAEKGYSLPADVYSWAVLCWEMFSSDRYNPLTGVENSQAVEMIEKGVRPEYDYDHGIDIRSIVSICWSTQPSVRPAMTIIDQYIEELILSKPKW